MGIESRLHRAECHHHLVVCVVDAVQVEQEGATDDQEQRVCLHLQTEEETG